MPHIPGNSAQGHGGSTSGPSTRSGPKLNRRARPTVRSPSGILTNAATAGGSSGEVANLSELHNRLGQTGTIQPSGGRPVRSGRQAHNRSPAPGAPAGAMGSAPYAPGGAMGSAPYAPGGAMGSAPYAPGGGSQGSAGAMGSAPNTPGTAAGWRPDPFEVSGQRYMAAAETYYDPVTGGNTPAYEAMRDAPTFGSPGAMGDPALAGGDSALEAFLAQVESDDWKNYLANNYVPPAGDAGGGGGAGAPAAAPLATIEDSYVDMYGDMRDDATTAFDTSETYFEDEGTATGDYWAAAGDRSGEYWDDRGLADEGYYGGVRDDTLEYLTGRQGREQDQILAMANMRRDNIGNEYQWMTDALDTEEGRRGGVYDQLELDRGARLDTNEAALLGQMGTLEGERLTQEQAMMDALGGRYTSAQGGLDNRRVTAEAALREQGVGPEAYTSAVGAETAALLGSQGLSSQDLQGRLASIAASESTDRQLGATGLFQDARSALADQLFGGRADLAENIAGRRTGLGQQNMQALAGVGTGELGAQQSLLNQIAQGQFGANQAYSTGMYGAGQTNAAGRFQGAEAATAGAFGAGQTQRAGMYGAQQAYQSEVSRIDQLEASGQISRAEAAQAKSEAAAKSSQAEAAEAAQFAQIDTQMGLTPGTAQAMAAGGLLGDLYGDLMGADGGEYENMMEWTPQGGTESYFVDPEIGFRASIDEQQGTPLATYPVVINGVEVQMPISGWPDVESSQEYEARR
jgi:hypothetical protein